MDELDKVLSRLQEAARRLRHDETPTFSQPATPSAIAALQGATSLPIQADFLAFLQRHDAIVAMSVWNGYWLGGTETLTRGIHNGSFPQRLTGSDESLPAMPVGTDGGGNVFLMCLVDGTIWKWNHEAGGSNFVASDFTAFLHRVAEDWEHYLAGDVAWSYLAG